MGAVSSRGRGDLPREEEEETFVSQIHYISRNLTYYSGGESFPIVLFNSILGFTNILITYDI